MQARRREILRLARIDEAAAQAETESQFRVRLPQQLVLSHRKSLFSAQDLQLDREADCDQCSAF